MPENENEPNEGRDPLLPLVHFLNETSATLSCIVSFLHYPLQRHLLIVSLSLSSQLNSVYFIELQRDVIGMEGMRERTFVRQGVLLKLSKKGYQQRMFFLFDDVLIYCSRSSNVNLQFKLHGILPLQNMMIEETPSKSAGKFCFSIYGGDRALMVSALYVSFSLQSAASHSFPSPPRPHVRSENDRQIWIRDINSAASQATQAGYMDEAGSFSDELMEKIERVMSGSPDTGGSESNAIQLRTNTMAYVCWHRNCSIGREEYEIALSVSDSRNARPRHPTLLPV